MGSSKDYLVTGGCSRHKKGVWRRVSVLTLSKTGRYIRTLSWLTRKPMTELRFKRAVYRVWKNGQATKEEFRNVAQVCRDAVGKHPYRGAIKKMKPGSHNGAW